MSKNVNNDVSMNPPIQTGAEQGSTEKKLLLSVREGLEPAIPGFQIRRPNHSAHSLLL